MARVLVIASLAESLLNFRGPLLKAMQAAGHQVFAGAPQPDSSELVLLREAGIEFEPVFMSRSGLNPIEDIKTILSVIRLCRRVQPDYVLAYTIKPVVYGLLAARLAGVQKRFALITGLGYAFIAEKGDVGRRVVNRLVQGLYRLALRGATGIFFQNPDDRDTFRVLGLVPEGSKVTVVNGSGVDTQHYSVTPLPERPAFLMIARLLVDKGLREYVAAARLVKQKYPAVPFLLVGPLDPSPSGVTAEELEQWVCSGAVSYLGELKDVRPAIAAATVYVLPSYREGTPRSVLEAMSQGRAIITSDAPGCRETVEPNVNGLLVPVQDVNALASAMLSLVEQPATVASMSIQSRRIAVEKYDVHKVNVEMLAAMGLA